MISLRTGTKLAALIAAGLALSAALAVAGCTPPADPDAKGGPSQQGNAGVGSAAGQPGSPSSVTGGQTNTSSNPAAVEPELSSVESLLTGVDADLAGAAQPPADAD